MIILQLLELMMKPRIIEKTGKKIPNKFRLPKIVCAILSLLDSKHINVVYIQLRLVLLLCRDAIVNVNTHSKQQQAWILLKYFVAHLPYKFRGTDPRSLWNF